MKAKPTLGSHVVLRDLEGAQKVFLLSSGANRQELRMGKYSAIPLETLLSCPYGAILRREADGGWQRVRHSIEVAEETVEVQENNQHLAQDNSAQSLSPSEVRDLKQKCSGSEVVEALASNSATFASKTKFAQEKYLKKKAQKHVQQVTLLRPSVMELCETYYKQSRNKVCGLRYDYLSSLLCQADVRSGARFLVLDCAAGLVAGAMAQQLAGLGEIYRLFRGSYPEKGLLELDLSESEKSCVRAIHLEALESSDPWSSEWLRLPEAPGDAEGEAIAPGRAEARLTRITKRHNDFKSLEAKAVDGLIVVAEDADLCAEVLELGLPRLSFGGRVCVFGHHLQPLAALQGAWRAGNFVDVRLTQLFTREFQALPLRTHPFMVADANLCEGFILCGSKVGEAEPQEAAGEDSPTKKQRRS
ncbi:unnamed protein product [Cladocopium goreaui]|uniref:tRNA (adenine(58)-N(1))-methyltransferase non-catalytic subunit TRM6 n=1 Tax=Cladocopium goreaui TaxID=2562237 RepID=A0A9P1G0L1_9DINO|nr:unnamed protein product [Cladocopium goreaui]